MKFLKEMLPYIIIFAVVISIRQFVVTPVKVDGKSMEPTLHDGDVLILKRYDHSYERFDIVVADLGGSKVIKRIIGLPGETIYYVNNNLFINGTRIDLGEYDFETRNFTLNDLGYTKVPEDTYFVLGDNRSNSKDSRYFGPIKKEDIMGVTTFQVWPLTDFGKIK